MTNPTEGDPCFGSIQDGLLLSSSHVPINDVIKQLLTIAVSCLGYAKNKSDYQKQKSYSGPKINPGGIRDYMGSDTDAVPSGYFYTTYHLDSNNQLTVPHTEMTSMTNEIVRDQESQNRSCNLCLSR